MKLEHTFSNPNANNSFCDSKGPKTITIYCRLKCQLLQDSICSLETKLIRIHHLSRATLAFVPVSTEFTSFSWHMNESAGNTLNFYKYTGLICTNTCNIVAVNSYQIVPIIWHMYISQKKIDTCSGGRRNFSQCGRKKSPRRSVLHML